jgi:GT2 family glycosyltransferase
MMDVVIVAYNSGDWLAQSVAACLQSVGVHQVIVCDNASSDHSIQKLPADPRIKVLAMGANVGFASACNAGWRSSKASVIAFVNPDCLPQPHQLSAIAALLDDQHIGIASAQLVHLDGSLQAPSLRRDPTPLRSLVQLTGLARLLPNVAVNMTPPALAGPVSVDACSGALMLMRKSTLEALQGFDAGYFLHGEDLDLCRRARSAGFLVVVDTKEHVVHGKGTSSQIEKRQVTLHKIAGMQRYFERFEAEATIWPIRALVRLALRFRRWLVLRRLT